MGIVVNLCEMWEPYRAARNALNNTVDMQNVKDIVFYFITLLILTFVSKISLFCSFF